MHISEALHAKQLPTVTTGTKQSNPTEQLSTGLSKDQVLACDIALSDYADLMSEQFKAWYCKVWYKIGRERFGILASQARADGKDPKKLFSYLLRKELNVR